MKRGILLVAVLAAVGTVYLRAQSRTADSSGIDARPALSAASQSGQLTTRPFDQVRSSNTRRKLPPAVDGKYAPEKISDEIAYRMFFAMLEHVATRSKESRAQAYLTQVFEAAARGRKDADHAKCVNIQEARTHHSASTQKVLAFMRSHQKDAIQVAALRQKGNGRAYFAAREAWANRLRSVLAAETSPAIARDVDWYVKNMVKKRTVIHVAPSMTTH